LEVCQLRVPEVLDVFFALNFNQSDSVPLFDLFLQMLQLIDHDLLLILQAFVLSLFEQTVFGHEKVAMLSLDVQIAILPD